MIILDFFGMPGSGKSTLSKHLTRILKQKGYRVKEPIRILDMEYSPLRRIITKSILSLKFSIAHFKFMKEIFSMVDKKAFLNPREFLKQWVNVSYTLEALKRNENLDFLIADEGIAQAVISLFSRCDNDRILECVGKMKNIINSKVIFIYVDTSTETVLNRLSSRRNGKSRVDKLEGDLKKNMLHRIKGNCSVLDKLQDTILINNEMEPEAFDYEAVLNKIL